MPTFSTPEPVQLRIRTRSGDVVLEATARTDTEVEVQPADPGSSTDTTSAEQTRVEFHDGQVIVEAPDQERKWFGHSGSVRIRVALPEGSRVRVNTASADVRATGRFGDFDSNTASGDVSVDQVARLKANTASGEVNCRAAEGDVKVNTASGSVSAPMVGGDAEVSTASGEIDLREVHGDVKVNTASGDAMIGTAHGSVTAKTASGDLSIKSVEQGRVSADGASGDVAVGVAAGTAAWLDVTSMSGEVVSRLDQAEQPGQGDKTVEVRVRTLSGDIVLSRA